MILYGSYARDDHDDESDVDIMILADIDREAGRQYREAVSEMAWELGMKHDVLISASLSGAAYFHDWRNDLPFYRNVWNEGRGIHA
jgi:predicted nucleotidyltransferase